MERRDDDGASEIGETVLDRPVRDFAQSEPPSFGQVADEKETELGRPTFDLDGNPVEKKAPPPPTAPGRRPALDAAPPKRPKGEARPPLPARTVPSNDPRRETLLYVGIGALALLILVLSVAIAIALVSGLD
jgi:hypothetical protein